jgi:hypothetical protein
MIEIAILALILGLAYLVWRGKPPRKNPTPRTAPEPPTRRPTFSRTPRRGSQRTIAVEKKSDKRTPQDRILDLHLRGAIFCVTEGVAIDGYDHIELGLVRVDAGPAVESRISRAAGQKFPSANALVKLREVRHTNAKGKTLHEWHAEAVRATPRDPALLPPHSQNKVLLIDGSNVINWYVDANLAQKPSLAPLKTVLLMLQARGQTATVVFDATIGHRLMDRFMGQDELAALLPLAADVLIVDKGTIADTILIEMARAKAMVIISNDHFRDHPLARHLLKQKGFATPQGITLLEPRP